MESEERRPFLAIVGFGDDHARTSEGEVDCGIVELIGGVPEGNNELICPNTYVAVSMYGMHVNICVWRGMVVGGL